MKQTELKVLERDTTLTPRQLRTAGYVPATLYGKGIEPRSIQVKAHEFNQDYVHGVRTFHLTGFLTAQVEVKAAQFDPVNRYPLSIQFWQSEGESDATPKKEAALAGSRRK